MTRFTAGHIIYKGGNYRNCAKIFCFLFSASLVVVKQEKEFAEKLYMYMMIDFRFIIKSVRLVFGSFVLSFVARINFTSTYSLKWWLDNNLNWNDEIDFCYLKLNYPNLACLKSFSVNTKVFLRSLFSTNFFIFCFVHFQISACVSIINAINFFLWFCRKTHIFDYEMVVKQLN